MASIIGQKFGKLTVLSQEKSSNGSSCEVVCDCGNHLKVITWLLENGRRKSCGCSSTTGGRHSRNWGGTGDLSGDFWSHVKRHATSRNLTFEITPQQAWELLVEQGHRCALSGVEITLGDLNRKKAVRKRTASLDRIDSKKGYVLENIQWVHKAVNKMKWDTEEPEFLNWCKLVSEHNK